MIQVDNSGTTLTLSGEVYQVNLGLLTKTGAGTLVLAGTQDNAGLGAIVDSGTLVLAKTSSANVHAIGGPGFTLAGGVVQLAGTGGQQIYSNSVDITVNSGTFDFNGNSAMMGGLAGTGGTILNNGGGASTITFGFNNDSPTYSGTITDHSTGNGTMAVVKVGTRYRDPQWQQQLQRRHNDQRGHDPGGQLHGVGFGRTHHERRHAEHERV